MIANGSRPPRLVVRTLGITLLTVFALLAIVTWGVGLLAYPVMWFLMPEEPAAPQWPAPTTPTQ